MLDIAITVAKYVGIILAGIFGILGLFVHFKDDEGHVTKAGWVALVLIVLSSIVSLATQVFDNAQKARETLEAVQRTEKLLGEIDRGLQHIDKVSLTYWIDAPIHDVKFNQYLDRFSHELPGVVSMIHKHQWPPGITGMSGSGADEVFDFNEKSFLAPKRDTEQLAYTILSSAGVTLQFFRQPNLKDNDPNSPVYYGSDFGPNQPDLEISVSAGFEHGQDGKLSVSYNLATKEFGFAANDIPSDPEYWRSKGNIVGVPDLYGTQLFIRCDYLGSEDATVSQYLSEIHKRFVLKTLILRMVNGQEIWLTKDMLKVLRDQNDLPIYEFVFPKTAAEFDALRK
jgi:hypothetical protein